MITVHLDQFKKKKKGFEMTWTCHNNGAVRKKTII